MITVSIPATSANCCVGFDSMGIALNWRGNFTFDHADELTISGCPQCYQNEDNLVIQAFDKTAEAYGKKREGLSLHIDSTIPFARGLGSSSTCVAAGIIGADAWFGLNLSCDEKLALATEIEGHPDNVAPAIFGGARVTLMKGEQPLCIALNTPTWHTLALIPDYEVSTPEARKVLPSTISHQDAVHQSASALAFAKALENRDEPLLKAACHDVLHEPYRKKLIPEYEKLKEASDRLNLPFWISGSGPTMLAVSLSQDKLKEFEKKVKELYPDLQTVLLDLDLKGAMIESV